MPDEKDGGTGIDFGHHFSSRLKLKGHFEFRRSRFFYLGWKAIMPLSQSLEENAETCSIEISSAPLQDEGGLLISRERDKAEVFIAFFASVFNTDDGPRESQCPELEDHDYKNDQLPTDPEIVQDLLLKLVPYKSMDPDGINPQRVG
ncbi:hypothetical protein WISP_143116 [Willisornis vidua]|uniref:Uncharacterized protein n=1 Tax=Willisornis vidua TaxID=1566151 RepID=A0ABQ9CQS3_9PASS|nr:hypothetical protein WISP_143116 [Willisornis vidua]